MQVVPQHYVPKSLNKKGKKLQKKELIKSRKMYKKGKYHTRKKISGYKSKRSRWETHLRKKYKIKNHEKITLKRLVKATKCKKSALKKIIKKGMGAYYSSGSRPNQTPHSWGYARLYSAISGGPASRVDKYILLEGCKKNSKAIKLAKNPKKYTKRKKVQLGGYRMKEKIIRFEKSPINGKKYRAFVRNYKTKKIRHIDFGASDYQQYKDRVPLKVYAHKNHGTRKRMRNYFNRHSGTPIRSKAIEKERKKSKGYFNAKILSHEYLW